MSTTVSELASRFHRDGYASPIPLLEPAKADAVRKQFDHLEAAEGQDRSQIGLLDRHFDQRFVWELATHPGVLDAVEAVIGPDIMLLATHFFCKYPSGGSTGREEPKFVAWHQDVTYWGLEPPFALTAWFAVDDSDVANGCMRVIPGTHSGLRHHGTSDRPGNLLSINQEIPVSTNEEYTAVDLVLGAGQFSLHHGLLIHGSNPNRSERRRCGLTLRYIPPNVEVVAENSVKRPWQPVLVRGVDRFRNHALRQAPFPPSSAPNRESP